MDESLVAWRMHWIEQKGCFAATKSVNRKTLRWRAKHVQWTTIHAGCTNDNKTAGANLGLIKSTAAWDSCNPSAWRVEIEDTFCLQDLWDAFGPHTKLFQFDLFFHFSPIFYSFIIRVLLATGMAACKQGWSVLAPAIWLIRLIVALWLGMLPLQDDNPEPC